MCDDFCGTFGKEVVATVQSNREEFERQQCPALVTTIPSWLLTINSSIIYGSDNMHASASIREVVCTYCVLHLIYWGWCKVIDRYHRCCTSNCSTVHGLVDYWTDISPWKTADWLLCAGREA